jgi:thiamine-phosphate pyrophosphorylase
VDAASLRGRGVGEVVGALARGGARLLQLRAKDLTDRAFLELAREAVLAARQAGVALLVNDRPDVARILGADGVHVGQDDLPARDARTLLGPEALIGLSTHGLEQLRATEAEPVDYVAIGPVFPTRTKKDPDPVVGVELVRGARAETRRALVAIGGITAANARAVVEAGADGVAVISDILSADDVEAALRRLVAAIGGA